MQLESPLGSTDTPESPGQLASSDSSWELDFGSDNTEDGSDISLSRSVHVLRLPADVLTLIFAMVGIDSYHDFVRHERFCPSPMLMISRVCSAWRDAAFSSPLLWTSIFEYLPWKPDSVNLHLGRSAPLPFDVHLVATEEVWRKTNPSTDGVDIPQDVFRNAYNRADALWHVLKNHMPRCRRLFIQIHDDFQPIMLNLLAHFGDSSIPLALLEELHLEEYSDIFSHSPMKSVAIFPKGAPALKKATIGVALSLPSYHQLTSLEVRTTFLTVSEFCSILSQCGLLEHLAICDDFKDGWPDVALPTLEFPSLSSIFFYDSLAVSSVLLLISAPRLDHLFIGRFYPQDLDEFYKHLPSNPGKFPKLKALTLALDNEHPPDGVLAALQCTSRCFPDLERATFVGERYLVASAALHARDMGGRLPWPKLHTLAFRSPIGLRELVAFRDRVGLPLRTIYLGELAVPGDQELAWLEERLEVVKLDVWDELRQGGMYFPYRAFGTEEEEDP